MVYDQMSPLSEALPDCPTLKEKKILPFLWYLGTQNRPVQHCIASVVIGHLCNSKCLPRTSACQGPPWAFLVSLLAPALGPERS